MAVCQRSPEKVLVSVEPWWLISVQYSIFVHLWSYQPRLQEQFRGWGWGVKGEGGGDKSIVVFLYYNSVCSQEDFNIVRGVFCSFYPYGKTSWTKFLFDFVCFVLPSVTWRWKLMPSIISVILCSFSVSPCVVKGFFLCLIKFMTGN